MEEFQDIFLSHVVHLDEELGRGAYGSIYKVKHNGETCFAKETYLFLADGDSEKEEAQKTIKSFLRECQRYTKLTPHPNLVNLIGVHFLNSCETARMRLPVMIMEIAAGTLTSFVNSQLQDIPINTKFSIIVDVAFGLYYLHSQTPPIVHCDLSPNSILMTNQGVAAIGDFGTYKILRMVSGCTMFQGDPDFMAPEVGNGTDPSLHYSVDVFAFAGIALYTFTQQWPKPSDPFEQVDCVDLKTFSMFPLSEVQRRMKYLNLMTGESTIVLKSIIKECLDMDPTRRPLMADVHEEIVNIVAALPNHETEPVNPSVTQEDEEKHSVAEFYKQICEPHTSVDQDKLPIYRLKPDSIKEIAEGVFEHAYGSTLVKQQELLPEKVIMIVGATGKGKSTLINRMVNHIFGIQCNDEFRFQLVVERDSLDQTKSQTKDINKYIICKSQLPYKLIITDTPGFGDTGGKQEDEKNIQKIKNLFYSGTMVAIDGICFVTHYNDYRLTEYATYVFGAMTNMFGKDVQENIFVIATFCDNIYDNHECIKKAPALQCIEKAGIPFKKSFPFNNKDIYAKLQNQIDIQYWETSATSFKHFFEELDKTKPISLDLSKKILQKKDIILQAKLPDFVRKLRNSIHVIDEHRANLRASEMKLKNPDKDIKHETEIEKLFMEHIKEPNVYCMKCMQCNKVCLDPCHWPSNYLWLCETMSWSILEFRTHCNACPNKCSWRSHESFKERPVYRTVKVTIDDEKLKQKYLKEKSEDLVKSCENEMVSAYGVLLKDLKDIQECLNFINKECLSIVPLTLEQYLNDIIEKETKTKEDGYLKRITFLSHLIANIKRGYTYEDFQLASKVEKLQQAKECYKEITN